MIEIRMRGEDGEKLTLSIEEGFVTVHATDAVKGQEVNFEVEEGMMVDGLLMLARQIRERYE